MVGNGRRPMTPKQLEKIGRRIWGDDWKSPLGRAIGRTYQQINAYHKGVAPIPRYIELAAKYLDEHPQEAVENAALGTRPPPAPRPPRAPWRPGPWRSVRNPNE